MFPLLAAMSRPPTPEERKLNAIIGACCARMDALNSVDLAAAEQTHRRLNHLLLSYLIDQLMEDDHAGSDQDYA